MAADDFPKPQLQVRQGSRRTDDIFDVATCDSFFSNFIRTPERRSLVATAFRFGCSYQEVLDVIRADLSVPEEKVPSAQRTMVWMKTRYKNISSYIQIITANLSRDAGTEAKILEFLRVRNPVEYIKRDPRCRAITVALLRNQRLPLDRFPGVIEKMTGVSVDISVFNRHLKVRARWEGVQFGAKGLVAETQMLLRQSLADDYMKGFVIGSSFPVQTLTTDAVSAVEHEVDSAVEQSLHEKKDNTNLSEIHENVRARALATTLLLFQGGSLKDTMIARIVSLYTGVHVTRQGIAGFRKRMTAQMQQEALGAPEVSEYIQTISKTIPFIVYTFKNIQWDVFYPDEKTWNTHANAAALRFENIPFAELVTALISERKDTYIRSCFSVQTFTGSLTVPAGRNGYTKTRAVPSLVITMTPPTGNGLGDVEYMKQMSAYNTFGKAIRDERAEMHIGIKTAFAKACLDKGVARVLVRMREAHFNGPSGARFVPLMHIQPVRNRATGRIEWKDIL